MIPNIKRINPPKNESIIIVVVKPGSASSSQTIKRIFMKKAGWNQELYKCQSEACTVDSATTSTLTLNMPIQRDLEGKVYLVRCDNEADAACIEEVKPESPTAWYTQNGLYVVRSDMGYSHTLYIKFDGQNWTYSANVTH